MTNIENLIPPIGTTKLEINTKHLESDEMFLSVLKHIYTKIMFYKFSEYFSSEKVKIISLIDLPFSLNKEMENYISELYKKIGWFVYIGTMYGDSSYPSFYCMAISKEWFNIENRWYVGGEKYQYDYLSDEGYKTRKQKSDEEFKQQQIKENKKKSIFDIFKKAA